jgi:D-ribose pyranase
VIADCGLPIPDGVTCIDLAYKLGEPSFLTILDVVLEDLKVEKAILAQEIQTANAEVEAAIKNNIDVLDYVTHEQFKQLTKEAKVIIRTGEITPYANIILQSGVIF